MATATDYASPPPPSFSRSSSLSVARSPDTASPIYPERAIRPLPKSRLKSKLSPEQASSIVFPPDPPRLSPTLTFGSSELAHTGNGHRALNGDAAQGHYGHHHPAAYSESDHDHCTCGADGDSDLDEAEFVHPSYRYGGSLYGTNGITGPGGGIGVDQGRSRTAEGSRASNKPNAPGSATSSADGYESFENTSNKKKRKIPLSGTNSIHQSQPSGDKVNMGVSGASMDGAADDMLSGASGVAVQQAANGRTNAYGGVGISGAGRGRYGRQNTRSEQAVRRPLASSSTNAHGYNTRLPSKVGVDIETSVDLGIENSYTGGIISQAIKSAAKQGPLTPQMGNENASLLSSATSAASTTNSKTQFTFAVESESGKMMDQHVAPYGTSPSNNRSVNGAAMPGRGGATSTNGTQTSASYRGAPPANAHHGGNAAGPPLMPQGSNQQPPQGPLPKPKPRRRPSKEYALAARQRKLQQEYTNYHHPPNKDNMYICEFCEYEDIFGVQPLALIRQYEIKDRAERKRAAEKRRLLEKARAKGRKNKKGSKHNKNGQAHGNAATAPAHHNSNYDPSLPPEGEEYYEDDYEGDDYDAVGPEDQFAGEYYPPPPPPTSTPQPALRAGGGDGGGGGIKAG